MEGREERRMASKNKTRWNRGKVYQSLRQQEFAGTNQQRLA
jgi:hypothetical protein